MPAYDHESDLAASFLDLADGAVGMIAAVPDNATNVDNWNVLH
jgi:hypothetical protein